jgi:hypothetical protein
MSDEERNPCPEVVSINVSASDGDSRKLFDKIGDAMESNLIICIEQVMHPYFQDFSNLLVLAGGYEFHMVLGVHRTPVVNTSSTPVLHVEYSFEV